MKGLTLQDFQERLKKVHPKENLKAISWGGDRQDSQVQCCTCGTVYTKKGGCFLDKRKISICKNCFPTQPNTLKDTYELPEGYSYIGEYTGMHHKVLIRHQCGFIWSVTPANLKLGKGCPKCNRKVSKGEQKIKQWLETNHIVYETQKPIKINNHTLFIDFYLTDMDLYIEYNGEQHYQAVNFFGGELKFKTQQANDSLKRQFLQDKLIEIPYTFFDQIENILKSSTTIPKGSMQQALVAEVENLLSKSQENDIVSTSSESQSSS